MTYVYGGIGVLYLWFLLSTLRQVLFQVSNPAKALSWILVVLFFPLLGILLFRLVGRNVKRDSFFQRNKPFLNTHEENVHYELLPKRKHRLVDLLHKNESAAISYGNQVAVLVNGSDTFKQIEEDLKNAKECIHLDFYIVEDGVVLNAWMAIFKEKIAKGIKVRLVYDGYGTKLKRTIAIQKLEAIGVEVQEFMPFKWWSIFTYLNYRNHRKLIILDRSIAFTGGMNISDKHIAGDPNLGMWRDTYVRIAGPAALDFERVFYSDWLHAGGSSYTSVLKPDEALQPVPVQVVSSGPDSEHRGIMQEYFAMITKADEYVYVSTPYFIPGEPILTALKTVALSGVDVRLMMPYKSDSTWLRWCMFTYLGDLLKSNVKVYLYHGGFLHNKVLISDDVVSSVGTANVDERSFDTNFEVNAIVYNQSTALELKQHFIQDIQSCELLKWESFDDRPDRNKIMEAIARLSSPVL